MPLNDSNFLMWFGPGESEFKLPLPRPFVREPEVLSPVVWWVPGENIAFYINSADNTALNGPIQLLHERSGNTKHNLTQALATISYPGGEHVYGNVEAPNLPEGYVRLTAGNYVSQYIWLTTAEKAAQKTVTVRFRNNQRLGGSINTRYSYLPENWYQQFRIRLAVRGEDSETNKETYTEGTTGKTRSLYSQLRQIVSFLTPEFNYWGHRALSAMLEHDIIRINNRPYQYHTGYKSNMNEGDALSQGEFALSDELSATINRN